MRRDTHAAATFRAHHAAGLQPRPGVRGGLVHQPEGDDAGAPFRLRRAEHLGAAVAQGAVQIADSLRQGPGHGVHAQFLKQREGGVQGVGAEHVRAAAFKAARVLGHPPAGLAVVAGVGDHMPAELPQPQALAHRRPAVEQRQALRAEHPFMAVGNHEIRVHLAAVETHRAQALDRVHAEQHAAVPAGAADRRQVQADTAAVLHRGQRYQTGAFADRVDHPLLGVRAAHVHFHHLDALVGQGLPGNPVGRELLIADHHLVAGPPIEPLGDHRQPFGGVLEQRHVRRLDVDQPTETVAQTLLHARPLRVVPGAHLDILVGEGDHRVAGAAGPGVHGGVVEIQHVVVQREFRFQVDHCQCSSTKLT